MSNKTNGYSAGPWRVKIHTGNGVTIGDADDWTVESASGLAVCFEGASTPEAHANAHLIAAAPELYETLKAIVDAGGGTDEARRLVDRIETSLRASEKTAANIGR